ncbi:MAG: pentapeptide repeat protein [Armatimonadetes bacterium]|jgi:hypothetical protein|nr:pentapeptide repeat protein [Armatimonadota bacterium]
MLTIKHRTSPDVVLLQMEAHTLEGQDLTGAELSGGALSGVNCRGTVFQGAVLRGANLRGAVLERANLSGADLTEADLRDADLTNAVLLRANLSGADLRGADVRGADFFGALLSGAELKGVLCDEHTRWPPGMKNCPTPPARPRPTGARPTANGSAGGAGFQPVEPRNSDGSVTEADKTPAPVPWWNRGPQDPRWSALAGAAVLVSVLAFVSTSELPLGKRRTRPPRAAQATVVPLTPLAPSPSPTSRLSTVQLSPEVPTVSEKPAAPQTSNHPTNTASRSQRPRPRAPRNRQVPRLRVPRRQRPQRLERSAAAVRITRHADPPVKRRRRRVVAVPRRRTHINLAAAPLRPLPSPDPEPVARYSPVASAGLPESQEPPARPSYRRPARKRRDAAPPRGRASAGNNDFHYGSGYDIYRMHSDRGPK